MQSQFGWNTQQAPVLRHPGARMGGFQAAPTGGPYSYPGPRSAQLPVRQPNSNCAHTHVHNEDYGNLVSQGFGPTWQGEHTAVGSPYSESCCSPPQDVGWISPMDAQPVYLSPVLLQSHLLPASGHFMHAPSFSATSQSSVSDSEEETICARSPDSGSHFTHIPVAHFPSTQVFEMDLDEPSTTTTAGDEDDGDEDETTYDEAEAWEEPFGDDLDTTIDYSSMRGAVESLREVEDFDVSLPASKTPCLDALAFCIALRLGAFQTPEDQVEGAITITNFHKLLTGIHNFCPKKSQTANEEARIKALKRWFEGIPTKRKRDTTFVMRIKDRKNPVVFQIIKKLQKYCIAHGFVRAANPMTQQLLRPMDA